MYRLFIPFHLADPGGILFFGHTFALMHQAFERFIIEELGCPWKEWFENPGWIVPIIHTEASFRSPIQAGEECCIKIEVASGSTSSFTLISTMSQKKECATVRTVHVFCDRKTQKKIAIPLKWAEKLSLLQKPHPLIEQSSQHFS